jgi:hypothetical protein
MAASARSVSFHPEARAELLSATDCRIELEESLEEGTSVANFAADKTGFHLTNEDEEELASALAAIRGGAFVDGRQLVAELKALKP